MLPRRSADSESEGYYPLRLLAGHDETKKENYGLTKKIGSSLASWKSAALLALVAMVAAVAFSGVLTNTQAEAQTPPDETIEQGVATVTVAITASTAGTAPTLDSADGAHNPIPNSAAAIAADEGQTGGEETAYTLTITVDATGRASNEIGTHTYVLNDATKDSVTVGVTAVQANPGGTVDVVLAGAAAAPGDVNVYNIRADSTAKGSFVANPGRTFVICADDAACDAEADTDDTTDGVQKTATIVLLKVKVAADSSKGMIFVTRGGDVTTERAIQVSPAQVATGLKVAGEAPGPVGLPQDAEGAGADPETITVTVTNNRGNPVPNQRVSLVTTRGQFTGCLGATSRLPVCNLMTGDKGLATAMLHGDNRPGSATITATAGTLERTLAVTFFGLADSLTASAAGGVATVDQAAKGFVILKVTDKDGNAVKGANPGSSATTEIENPTVVTLDNSVEYEGTPSPADNVQACADGTNVAGQCAVQVTAAANASRGIHTVASSMTVTTPAGPKVLSDTIDIRVVGKPHSIETDAPESVAPRTRVTINISVFDDEGELVGGGKVKVAKLEGRGAVLGTDDDDNVTLVGGKASFRYYATSTDAAAVFELTVGAGAAAVTEILEIVVGAAAEAPAATATWNNELVSGQNFVVWNGADGADPSAGAADGVTAIWSYNTGSGKWDGYFPGAADVPGGNTLTSLSNGQAYVVIVE